MPEFSRHAVTVRVPATSANLGPGYDSLGLALSIYDEVTVRVRDGATKVTVEGEGASRLPSTDKHLVAVALRTAVEELGGTAPAVELHCRNAIPQTRGLGSSSAAIVAGVKLAAYLMPDAAADADALLDIAARMEGHPDNVAPCLLGGFTVAWSDDGTARAVSREVVDGLAPVVYVPAGRGLTARARAVLPASVPHDDAAFNVARAALAVCAFTTDATLMFDATADRLHQTYRAASMPDSAALVERLRQSRIPAMISGAGPSVLAFTREPARIQGFELHKLRIGVGAHRIGAQRDPQVLPYG